MSSTFLLVAAILLHKGLACVSTGPRQFSAPTVSQQSSGPVQTYHYNGVPQYSPHSQYPYGQYPGAAGSAAGYPGGQYSGAGGGQYAARAAASGTSNVEQPISSGEKVSENLLGPRVQLSEFSSNGYNAEGGGPVAQGAALGCDFEGRPCCWANVPTPDDQIDWQMANGVPESQTFQNVSIQDKYLVAYASGAAPSDEAQFASCSIGCASSLIRVRARHWQSSNVLLQVCQRESFPNSINFNPLLNCQEFPMVHSLGFTELVLPKASLVDIVFVASNFVNENGDIAVIDNIEINYESDASECENSASTRKPIDKLSPPDERSKNGLRSSPAGSKNNGAGGAGSVGGGGAIGNAGDVLSGGKGGDKLELIRGSGAVDGGLNSRGSSKAGGSKTKLGTEGGDINESNSGSSGSSQSSGGRSSAIHGANTEEFSSSSSSSLRSSNSSSSSSFSSSSSSSSAAAGSASAGSSLLVSSEENSVIAGIRACQTTKCTFEDGTTCAYKDTYETESVRGLATRFQVVRGQFMNRVTGVREEAEGNYYAATFLYPREKAGLAADVGQLPEDRRLRFQYYEGTHGVQLKGCCDSVDICPFSSDKFVTVSDRMWKFGSFACPRGTQKVIFLCENTRTNQGACALDDIQVVENSQNVSIDDKPLC